MTWEIVPLMSIEMSIINLPMCCLFVRLSCSFNSVFLILASFSLESEMTDQENFYKPLYTIQIKLKIIKLKNIC